MKIVTVIPLKKGAWKENLTYFSAQDIPNGSIVTISLRGKKILGLVISSEDVSALKSNIKSMSFNLKKITELKERSVFLKEYLDSAIETSKYFAGSKNNGITALLPASLRENYDRIAKFQNSEARPNVLGLASLNRLKSEKLLFQAPLEDRISAYKTLIRGSFALKKSVFIVLPIEYDIKKFKEILSKGIEQFTFAIHGGLSAKKIIKKFEEITTASHPILILGTAPFLSVPRNDLETIIVEHESSSVYKMIGRPYFDLRFFAELYATKINARLIFSDTLLRYETLARVERDGLIPMHPLSYRINFAGEIEILNKEKKFKILNEKSVREIKNAIAKKKNVLLFALRKGLATMTLCRNCNDTVSCEKCGAPLVLYLSHQEKKRMFVCNRCQENKNGDIVCISCGSWDLLPLGIGTDTVSEYAKEIFPGTKIFKLDKDSVKNTKEAEKIIEELEKNPGSILIGTEMAFFYLKNKVSLSVVVSFDSLWNIPNFKMSEKIIQIVFSIISNTTEKIMIQTKNENDSALRAIKTENLLSFVREELEDREKLDYPPFKRFIKITHLGDKEQTIKAKRMLEEIFQEYNPEIFSGFIARLKGKYVTNALIKIEPEKWSLPEISLHSSIDENLLAKLLSLPPSFDVFVDPEDLL
ncbi:MAG: hypothetical protein AAB661_02350 [Patescibacteria group bacterium]